MTTAPTPPPFPLPSIGPRLPQSTARADSTLELLPLGPPPAGSSVTQLSHNDNRLLIMIEPYPRTSSRQEPRQ